MECTVKKPRKVVVVVVHILQAPIALCYSPPRRRHPHSGWQTYRPSAAAVAATALENNALIPIGAISSFLTNPLEKKRKKEEESFPIISYCNPLRACIRVPVRLEEEQKHAFSYIVAR